MNASFALFGAPPAFDRLLPVGQLYFPSWERYETAFRALFEPGSRNGTGSQVRLLEAKLQEFLGVKHAICVSNATLGLMMLPDALGLSGKVILPSFTFAASAQSLSWAGLQPVFCDIDLRSHQIDPVAAAALIDPEVSAIMGVNLWGGACEIEALAGLARDNGIKLYFDSAHAFGCMIDGTRIGNFGEAEVFSFHATKILNATEGGCICTNDDNLAARLRGMRTGNAPAGMRNAGAMMSDAQATVALLSLEDFAANRDNNEALYHLYATRLEMIPGLRLVRPAGVSFSNFQYLVCEVNEKIFGLPRDLLVQLLKAENVIARRYFHPGIHRTVQYEQEIADPLPNTEKLCNVCIQFPIGALVTSQAVERICDIIADAHRHATEIRARHG